MKTSRKKDHSILRTLKYMRGNAVWVIFSIISTLIYVAATLTVPVIIGRAEGIIKNADNVDFSAVNKYILIIAAATAIAIAFQYLSSVFITFSAQGTVKRLRIASFEKLNRTPFKFIDSASHGDIITRLSSDCEMISEGLVQGFSQLTSGIATIVGTAGFMFFLSRSVTAMIIALTPLSVITAFLIAKGCHSTFSKQAEAVGNLGGLAEEMIGGLKTVKAFGYEDRAEERFDAIDAEIKRYGTKAVFYSALINPSTRLLNGIIYVAVCFYGAILAMRGGTFGISELSAFLIYSLQYAKPFNEITNVISDIQAAAASASRVFAVIDEKEEENESHKPAIGICGGNVSFKNVNFSYTDAPLIENFNLEVLSGKRVAIVGPTGCGKTTLINLLMRFYETDSGYIALDGKNTADYTRESVRNNFGMVLQDTWLFSGTIRQNIAYGKQTASDEEVIEAAKKAHMHAYISRLDKGYDTPVGEQGALSEGQKQLLCIARILLAQPSILILDEATSNIDTRTEIKIQRTFAEMMKGRTSFVVAHRLSTIVEADIILVMRQGKIIEQGRHEELLAKKGFYYELYSSQFSSSESS